MSRYVTRVCISEGPFNVGDPAPSGYVDWHEWADVQVRGGIKQSRCRARREKSA